VAGLGGCPPGNGSSPSDAGPAPDASNTADTSPARLLLVSGLLENGTNDRDAAEPCCRRPPLRQSKRTRIWSPPTPGPC
jgi:hypothetical protein